MRDLTHAIWVKSHTINTRVN